MIHSKSSIPSKSLKCLCQVAFEIGFLHVLPWRGVCILGYKELVHRDTIGCYFWNRRAGVESATGVDEDFIIGGFIVFDWVEVDQRANFLMHLKEPSIGIEVGFEVGVRNWVNDYVIREKPSELSCELYNPCLCASNIHCSCVQISNINSIKVVSDDEAG